MGSKKEGLPNALGSMSFQPSRAARSTDSCELPPPIHIASFASCTGGGCRDSPEIGTRNRPDQWTGLPFQISSSSRALSANRSLDSSRECPNSVYVEAKKLPRPPTMSTRPSDSTSRVA